MLFYSTSFISTSTLQEKLLFYHCSQILSEEILAYLIVQCISLKVHIDITETQKSCLS